MSKCLCVCVCAGICVWVLNNIYNNWINLWCTVNKISQHACFWANKYISLKWNARNTTSHFDLILSLQSAHVHAVFVEIYIVYIYAGGLDISNYVFNLTTINSSILTEKKRIFHIHVVEFRNVQETEGQPLEWKSESESERNVFLFQTSSNWECNS